MAKELVVGMLNDTWEVSIVPVSGDNQLFSLNFMLIEEPVDTSDENGLVTVKDLPDYEYHREDNFKNIEENPIKVSPAFKRLWGLDKPNVFKQEQKEKKKKDFGNITTEGNKYKFDYFSLIVEPPGYVDLLGFITIGMKRSMELVERGINLGYAFSALARAISIEPAEINRIINMVVETLKEEGSQASLQTAYLLQSDYFNPWTKAKG